MDRRNWKKRILALILPAFLMLFGFASGAQQADTVKAAGGNNRLEVHFMDVGQGDATLIMTDGHAMQETTVRVRRYRTICRNRASRNWIM